MWKEGKLSQEVCFGMESRLLLKHLNRNIHNNKKKGTPKQKMKATLDHTVC